MLVSSSSKRSKLYPKARDYCILCISSPIIRNFGKFKRYLRLPQKFSWGGENKFRGGGDGTPSHPRSYVPVLYNKYCLDLSIETEKDDLTSEDRLFHKNTILLKYEFVKREVLHRFGRRSPEIKRVER